MLDIGSAAVLGRLFEGSFGLEREGLRVTSEGRMSHTPDPFPGRPNMTRDFCENQVEINTGVYPSASLAVSALRDHTAEVERGVASLAQPELYWPFSNPPYIASEQDVPIARFEGEQAVKTEYREHLARTYGRYRMSLCGIHVNFSFSGELLAADLAAKGGEVASPEARRAHKEGIYLGVLERAMEYGWLLTALTAASPLLDSSYYEKGVFGREAFGGMGSVRCGELGYWNFFAPVFDLSGIGAYANSIERNVADGLIAYASELYYPVRLKPPGDNTVDGLRERGVSHIELRMFDLNPYCPEALDVRDVQFAHLFLVWCACQPRRDLAYRDQVHAVQNFKNAAHYDLKTVNVVLPDGGVGPVADVGLQVMARMEEFFAREEIARVAAAKAGFDVGEVLAFERGKLEDPQLRYAWRVRRDFAGDYVAKGLELARRQRDWYLGRGRDAKAGECGKEHRPAI